MSLDHRVGVYATIWGCIGLARYTNTGAGRIIGQAMIRAFDAVARESAFRQRGVPVGALVSEGNGRTVFPAVEDHGLFEKSSSEKILTPNFGSPGTYIPSISQEHLGSPKQVETIRGDQDRPRLGFRQCFIRNNGGCPVF